jgi:hypothetical protein
MPSRKSLPSSLFQREESFWEIRCEIPLSPPFLEKGGCEKNNRGREETLPDMLKFPGFTVPVFFHTFREMNLDFTAFQKVKLLRSFYLFRLAVP